MDAIVTASASWTTPQQADVDGALDSITLLRATVRLSSPPRGAATNSFAVSLADAISPALVYWPATAANHPLLHGNHLTDVLTACAALFGRPQRVSPARRQVPSSQSSSTQPQSLSGATSSASGTRAGAEVVSAPAIPQPTSFGSALPYEDVPRGVRRCIDRIAQVLRTSLANRTSMALGPSEVITLLTGALLVVPHVCMCACAFEHGKHQSFLRSRHHFVPLFL